MTVERHAHIGLPLALLGLAFAAFMMTGTSQAGSGAGQDNPVYGPYMRAVSKADLPDKLTIQRLISSQLDAIRERDADMAYALMTGTFHKKFDTAGKFLSEMRFSYRPVYNHESYKFLEQAETETGGLIQRVEVTYTHGEPTEVIYRLQRNQDGEWGIDSFTIIDTDEGQPI